MKKTIILALLVFSVLACQNDPNQINSENLKTNTEMKTKTETTALEILLFNYRDALNASDTNKAVSLYTEDGVFMPTNAPTAQGTAALIESYNYVFSNIQLKVEFYIDSIEVNGDYAYARTRSKGSTLIHATGDTIPEENRELFVLKKENDEWKIDNYMFNKTK